MQESGFFSEVLFLGNRSSVEDQGRLSVRFYFPSADLLSHVFVLGDQVAGKTLLAKSFVEELVQKGLPSLVIDLKGDLSSLGLLVEDTSAKYMDLWKRVESDPKKSREMARQAFANHLKQLGAFGYNEEYIRQIKADSDIAIFTPKSGKGIPLAISSLMNAPGDIAQMLKDDPAGIKAMVAALTQSLLYRLYKEQAPTKQKETALLNALILYAWGNKVDIEGLAGLVKLTEFVDTPPIEEVEGKLIDEFISADERFDLTQRLYNFSVVERELWYKGVPLDIDLICRKQRESGKANIAIINLSELDIPQERSFVISRILYSVYCWMKKHGVSKDPRLFVCLDEIGGDKPLYPAGDSANICKAAIDLLLKDAGGYGVSILLGTQYFSTIDYKGLSKCKTWAFGKFSSEAERKTALEGAISAGVSFDRMDPLVKSLTAGEFVIRLRSGDVVNVRRKSLASFHLTIPPSFLPRVVEQEVREYFKAFYVSGSMKGSEAMARLQASDLTPRVIFDNFDFGVGSREQFVLDVEPEDAIILCLKELAEEDIFVEEVQFKNVQIVLTRAHNALWKVDTLVRNSMGQVLDRIKDEGRYFRFDSSVDIDEVTREKVLEMINKSVVEESAVICDKVSLVLPDAKELTLREVRQQVSREINVAAGDVQVSIKEQNIALSWKFTMDYRGKLIESVIDMVNRHIRTDFPSFSAQEALDEIKKSHPDFNLDANSVSSRVFYHVINYATPDKVYMFQVNRRSGKIMKEKVSLSESKAREIAHSHKDEEPFLVRKYKNAWHFYYHSGVRLVVDEETGRAFFRDLVSAEAVDALAISALTTKTGPGTFQIIHKEFKDGKWILKLISQKWEAEVEVNEDARVTSKIRLRREYCLAEARKLMGLYQVQVAMYNNADPYNDGWSFEFFSSLGDFIVRIEAVKSEFLKKRLTAEGIRHFVSLETGGEIVSVKDRDTYWDVIVKKEKNRYSVLLSKQDGMVKRVRVKSFLFLWKDVNPEYFKPE